MWASVATLFTSPSLFVLLNIVIATIFLTSRLSSSHRNPDQPHQPDHSVLHPLGRSPSLLDRVKSIDFSLYNYSFTPSNDTEPELHNQTQLARAPSLLDRVKSINFSFQKFSPPNYQEEEVSVSDHPPAQPLARAPSLLERVKSIDFTSFYNRLDSGKVNPSSEAEQPGSRGSDPGQVKTSDSDQGKVTQRKVNDKMKKSASELYSREEGEEELERRRPATVKVEKKKASGETVDVDAKADDFINRFKQQLRLQRLDSILRYKETLNPK